jgi:hypothetical protein
VSLSASESWSWLTIEDEDGFTTSWRWPRDQTMLANAEFVRIFEEMHEYIRETKEEDDG